MSFIKLKFVVTITDQVTSLKDLEIAAAYIDKSPNK